MKAYGRNIQTGSFMVRKPLLQRGHGALTITLKENGSAATKKTAIMNNQIYGNDRVGWGRTATASWTFDRDHAGYAGQFIWTGTDYIGEPTPWHKPKWHTCKSSYFGIVDTAGLPKNDFYLYQSQWVSAEKHPMVHLLPHWNWDNPELANRVMDEEGRIPVRTFSNAHSVDEGRTKTERTKVLTLSR